MSQVHLHTDRAAWERAVRADLSALAEEKQIPKPEFVARCDRPDGSFQILKCAPDGGAAGRESERVYFLRVSVRVDQSGRRHPIQQFLQAFVLLGRVVRLAIHALRMMRRAHRGSQARTGGDE